MSGPPVLMLVFLLVLGNDTRAPENPGNPPIFKPVNLGVCALENPGLTGSVSGVSTACRAWKSMQKFILLEFWESNLQVPTSKFQIQSESKNILTPDCLLSAY